MHNKSITSFINLLRLNQPTGIWLLLLPCWWGIILANNHNISLRLLLLFTLGAFIMRSAGCIINDIVDREFDKQVERTRNRPLANGDISLSQAIILLIVLLIFALIIAIQMNISVIILASCALIAVFLYPFMKRITWYPQAFLGITFNFGVLLGFVAANNHINLAAIILYFASIFWTIGYDTIYAHQDKLDDIKIGVKSTDLRFANKSKQWLLICYLITLSGWTLSAFLLNSGGFFYLAIFTILCHFIWQIIAVDLDNSKSCMKFFKSNVGAGLILLLGLILR